MAQATHFCHVCLAFSAAVSLLNLCVVKVIRYSWCLHCGFHLEAKASRTALQRSSTFGSLFTIITVKISTGMTKDGWWNRVWNISDLLSLVTSLAAFPTVPAASCAVSSFTTHLAYPQLNCRSIWVIGVVLGMLHMFQGRKDRVCRRSCILMLCSMFLCKIIKYV